MTSSSPRFCQHFEDIVAANDLDNVPCRTGGQAPDAALIGASTPPPAFRGSVFDDNDDQATDAWLHPTFLVLYGVVFLLGLTGNILVVFVVVRSSAMHTVFNIFLANLAVSDILMCLLAVPFTPLSILQSWAFGDVVCHIVPMTLGVTVHVSTMTSTVIAVNRYVIIVHPYREKLKPAVSVVLVAFIWSLSVLIALPLAVFQTVEWDERDGSLACVEAWPSETAKQFFTVGSIALQYLIPCAVIVFCYVNVSLTLRVRARTIIGSGRISRNRIYLGLLRNRRTNRMLIAMVSIFACCWMPLNAFHIVNDYSEVIREWKHFYGVFLFAHLMAMSSTIYNPFLYGWMNTGFWKEFQHALPCLFRR